MALNFALISFLLPLAGALIVTMLAQNSRIAGRIATLFTGSAMISSILLAFQSWIIPVYAQWPWFQTGGSQWSVGILINTTSVLMSVLVLFISFCVHLFSISYMKDERMQVSYYARLGLFTGSMTGIVFSSSLVQLFLFWELVSFSSFLLIGYWSENPRVVRAATSAFFMNQIGDLLMLSGIVLIGIDKGTLDLPELGGQGTIAVSAGLLLLAGIMAKSAQIPFLTWLTNAMEGPTPVSALIHAATMVAAGIYFIIRIHTLLPSEVLQIAALIGSITGLAGGLGALASFDLKRILAFSTISQLGFMLLGGTAGTPGAAMLHLYTHAIFKALLFLTAGVIIHQTNEQDIRKIGQIKSPLLTIPLLMGAASMIGLPLTAGFISKETIIESLHSGWPLWSAQAVTLLTTVYTTRLIYFLLAKSSSQPTHSGRPDAFMMMPVAVLAAGCLWIIVSWSPVDFSGSLMRSLDQIHNFEPGMMTYVTLALIISSATAAFFWFRRQSTVPGVNGEEDNFGLDVLYRNLGSWPLMRLSLVAEWTDQRLINPAIHFIAYIQVAWALFRGWIDKWVVDGTITLITEIIIVSGDSLRMFTRGKIQSYILWAFLMLVIFIIWIIA
ncbi:MAG: NADH-quinone oxidoreductase subunit L [Bacteroidetes bacterium]|nr:NADH-quinone oxidoreductase subunit L [Bacteroidota bacterium]